MRRLWRTFLFQGSWYPNRYQDNMNTGVQVSVQMGTRYPSRGGGGLGIRIVRIIVHQVNHNERGRGLCNRTSSDTETQVYSRGYCLLRRSFLRLLSILRNLNPYFRPCLLTTDVRFVPSDWIGNLFGKNLPEIED